MECTVCSRSLADDVRVEAVRAATVPPPGGEGFSADDHVAIIQPVVLAFAQYLHERVHVSTTDRAARMPRGDSGRCSHHSETRSTPFASSPRSRRSPSRHRIMCFRSQTERRSSVIPPWCDRDQGRAKRPIGPEPDRPLSLSDGGEWLFAPGMYVARPCVDWA